MKAIKHGNKYGLVLSKDELRVVVVSLGMASYDRLVQSIKSQPSTYGDDPINISTNDLTKLFIELKNLLMDTDD